VLTIEPRQAPCNALRVPGRYPYVVEGAIEPAKPAQNFGDELLDVSFRGHVRPHEEGLDSGGVHETKRVARIRFVDVVNRQLRTIFREGHDDGAPDPACGFV
jgi:hypothetical protein